MRYRLRPLARRHASPLAAFLVMLTVAGTLGATLEVPQGPAALAFSGLPKLPIPLPTAAEDEDRDSYPDLADVWRGDLMLRFDLTHLKIQGSGAKPYVVIGSDDDHWRMGKGAELEWKHVVDYDPLGREPGSRAWERTVLRTGTWLVTHAGPQNEVAIGTGNVFTPDEAPSGSEWPQSVFLNVRDDKPLIRATIELWDAAKRPDASGGRWDIEFDLLARAWRVAGSTAWHDAGAGVMLGSLGDDPDARGGLGLSIETAVELDAATKEALASRWAPILKFDSEERLFPTAGEALSVYHGFGDRRGDYRTWSLDFNNGRDGYNLLIADFNGDRRVDRRDATALTDILRAGNIAPPYVYANVLTTTGGRVVVQYWFIYMYNYVLDETGRDVPTLAHAGDREFIQLVFADLDAARNGTPSHAAFSQHYHGIRFSSPEAGEPPFHLGDTHIAVYPARGSHASYPVPGDDDRLRPAFLGYGDRFDGAGETWQPGTYTLEVFDAQPWQYGHLWGPMTRFTREFGTATKPLLKHSFAYPFTDPLYWMSTLVETLPDDLANMYGAWEQVE